MAAKATYRILCMFACLLFGLNCAAEDKSPHLFKLPASPLADALIEFAQQAEVSILVDASLLEKLSSEALNRVMTIDQGLQHLLAGTGLAYRYINYNTVTISKAVNKSQPVVRADPDSNSIDNIIVTALRQSENLQDTPAAVSVLNRQVIEYDAIANLEQVASRVPGLTVSTFSIGQPTIHIRGIGSNDDGPAMDHSVVVFIDDVYMGRITGINLDMVDIRQVEVLRGPQGVLYGKNVIGGAIKLSSQPPTDETELALGLSLGNFNYQQLKLLANGPLQQRGEKALLARMAIQSTRRDGWQDNIFLGGEKQHNANNWGMRSQLSTVANEQLDILWSVDFSQDKLNSSGRIPVRGGRPVPLLDEQGVIATGADGEPLSRLPTAIFADLGGSPKKAANSVQGYTDRSIAGVSQRVDLRGDSVTLTSITAWRDIQFEWLEDSTGLPATTNSQTLSLMDDESHRQFSQELRWANDTGARLAYVLGGYYLYEHTRRKETFPFQAVTAISDQTNTTDSVALFGQLRYQLTKPLTLALGGRYTYDRKTISQTAINGGAPSIIFENFRSKNSADWEAFSPQLSLSLDAGNDLLLYGSISHGWKSGGFQGVPGTKQAAQQEVLPETALEYELGAKSDWFQHRLRINVAAFYTNYRNLQVVQFQTIDDFGLFQTSNAASANVSGVEIESWAQLSRHWSMSGTYAYLNARYDTFIDLQGRDFSSSFLRQSPEHSASVALEYRRPVSLGTMRLRMDYRYQSDSYREPDNSIGIMPAYSLMDASAHLQGADQRWELSVWAKNLRDEQYISHLYLLGGNDYALYGTPRQFGVSLSWRLL